MAVLAMASTLSAMCSIRNPAADPPAQACQEHAVTLRKSIAQPIGMDLTVGDGFSLRVKSVDGSGAIGEWNKSQPTMQVKSGDLIVEVNGKTRNSHAMLQEVTQSWNLRLVVRRISEVESQIQMMQFRDIDPEDFELLRLLDETNPRTNQGALMSTIGSLPRIEACRCLSSTCGICLEPFAADALLTQLPCQHPFCTQCIEVWLTTCKSNCPICQTNIDEGSTAPPSEDNDECRSSISSDELSVGEEVDENCKAATPTSLNIRGATHGLSFHVIWL